MAVERGRKLRANKPVIVIHVLHHRPQTDEQRIGGQSCDRGIGAGCGKLGPADHAGNERGLVREIEQESRLGLRRRSLHQDGGRNSMRSEMRGQIFGIEVAIDRAERGRQPRIVAAGDAPEMLMRVDPRCHG